MQFSPNGEGGVFCRGGVLPPSALIAPQRHGKPNVGRENPAPTKTPLGEKGMTLPPR